MWCEPWCYFWSSAEIIPVLCNSPHSYEISALSSRMKATLLMPFSFLHHISPAGFHKEIFTQNCGMTIFNSDSKASQIERTALSFSVLLSIHLHASVEVAYENCLSDYKSLSVITLDFGSK
jgi:hypothetical protein